ncbi:hypothetical protein AWJ14_09125 [Hoeflea olei]|uniref:N-acetyltransferase domain-containing protein n=2 Tax=Hoeflea olei TaxID=1480615 RepID=A0A1C1Z0B3_9HYPH|nr:hypothetical protein AWJ14_09125 [Hoeflea olei]
MEPAPVIRPAEAGDLAACAAIINAYIDATPWLPRTASREAIEDMFGPDLLDRRAVFVAEAGDGVAGYLSMDPEAGFIHALYLKPGHRGQGLGKALLDAAKHARPQGYELTVFEPNTEAQRFYRREGMIEVPEGRTADTEEGVPTLLMRWPGGIA